MKFTREMVRGLIEAQELLSDKHCDSATGDMPELAQQICYALDDLLGFVQEQIDDASISCDPVEQIGHMKNGGVCKDTGHVLYSYCAEVGDFFHKMPGDIGWVRGTRLPLAVPMHLLAGEEQTQVDLDDGDGDGYAMEIVTEIKSLSITEDADDPDNMLVLIRKRDNKEVCFSIKKTEVRFT